jgi:hypothetical protein
MNDSEMTMRWHYSNSNAMTFSMNVDMLLRSIGHIKSFCSSKESTARLLIGATGDEHKKCGLTCRPILSKTRRQPYYYYWGAYKRHSERHLFKIIWIKETRFFEGVGLYISSERLHIQWLDWTICCFLLHQTVNIDESARAKDLGYASQRVFSILVSFLRSLTGHRFEILRWPFAGRYLLA